MGEDDLDPKGYFLGDHAFEGPTYCFIKIIQFLFWNGIQTSKEQDTQYSLSHENYKLQMIPMQPILQYGSFDILVMAACMFEVPTTFATYS